MLSLMFGSVLEHAIALPIVVPDDFQYPSTETYLALGADVTALCSKAGLPDAPLLVRDFVKSLFNHIACRFSVQSDSATLNVQAKSILDRTVGGSGSQASMVPQAMCEEVLGKLSIDWSQFLQSHSAAAVSCNSGAEFLKMFIR